MTKSFLGFSWFIVLLSVTLQPCRILIGLSEKNNMDSDKLAKDPKKGRDDGKKSYCCNQCNYTGDTPSKLKRHMLVHSGEKPFACTKCNFSAAQKINLKSHMLIHSGEKPYSCKQYIYSFNQPSTLKKHMLSHSGDCRPAEMAVFSFFLPFFGAVFHCDSYLLANHVYFAKKFPRCLFLAAGSDYY